MLLNGGRLAVAASADVTLGAAARIDLEGEAVALFDQTRSAQGGTAVLASAGGNITTDVTSVIDVAGAGSGSFAANAGSISALAASGTVQLAGALEASAPAGLGGGSFVLDAATLPDFDALNARLDLGGVYGSRSFEVGTGNLVVQTDIKAHRVSIAADGGNLTVAGSGVIDASGAAPGSITLAAAGDLTLADKASLLAQGSVLQTDSTGTPIASENQAEVSLSTTAGTLTLGSASIDVAAAGGLASGVVTLNAPRSVVGGAEQGDIAIDAPAMITTTNALGVTTTEPGIAITGAATIALYGSRTYTPTDANGTIEQHAVIGGSVTLDELQADNTDFLAAAATNADLAARTAGLSVHTAAYHLRPADVIQSSDATGGNLTVNGDLDLSSLRYGPGAVAGVAGSGDVGLLSLRAADNLVVNGSITDGFAPPADLVSHTNDDKGWLLYASEPLGQNVTLPVDLAPGTVLLANRSNFSTVNGGALNYAITIGPATLNADVVIPTTVVTASNVTIPAGGFTATGTITGPDGTTLIAVAGQVLPAATVIPAGSTLAAGNVLPVQLKLATGTVWPANASLALFASPTVALSLAPGTTLSLAGGAFIPSGSVLVFPKNPRTHTPPTSVSLRPTGSDGEQGAIYAVANLLPAGSQSWSINLVAGANLGAANVLAVQPATSLAGLAGTAADPAGSVVLSDTHYTLASKSNPSPSFSVVRTGTGSLNVVAGGNVDQASLFGVYTAGTQTSLGATENALFQAGRATLAGGTVLPSTLNATYGAVIAGQQQYYPDNGGNLLVSAGNSVLGDIVGPNGGSVTAGTDLVGNWLWKQGGAGLDQATAWWINFGSYVLPLDGSGNVQGKVPTLAGFTGFGALGGGNVTVNAGGNAGEIGTFLRTPSPISKALVVAVGSTGRVDGTADSVSGGIIHVTGGGDLTLDVGGTLNPTLQAGSAYGGLGGTLTDPRGNIVVDAGQVGRIDLNYGLANTTDPRPLDPYTTQNATSTNGVTLVQGDGVATIDTLRDLVLSGGADAGRESPQALTKVAADLVPAGNKFALGGDTGFSLWTDATAIDLFAAGGNLTPTTALVDMDYDTANSTNLVPTDNRFVYPGTLDATAASGSFYYGQQAAAKLPANYSLELAPARNGQLSFLAANSIFAHGYTIDMSGAAEGVGALPGPDDPSYTDLANQPFSNGILTDFMNNAATNPSPDALFGFEFDTPTADLHEGDSQPMRFYAVNGDIVDLQSGEEISYPVLSGIVPDTLYLAAKPSWIIAGRDIVSTGTRPSTGVPTGDGQYPVSVATNFPNAVIAPGAGLSSGDLLLNNSATNVSVVSAGRDILSAYVYVAGPGTLEVDAGRNINQTGATGGASALDFGIIKSVGPVFDTGSASRSSGADIAVLAGVGSAGPATTAFADLYLNMANQADLNIPLSDPANDGKVQQTYQAELLSFLRSQYGYAGTPDQALAAFLALPETAQNVFVRRVFYQELLASGRQESDTASLFYKSYARGRLAISTLFPLDDANNKPIAYSGGVTLDSGTATVTLAAGAVYTSAADAGISTLFGGNVQLLTPGGSDVLGIAGGPIPGANSGIITFGAGDVDIYALGSVLLGQSRIFTTFGGNILIWSAQGDINAGRGSKTTTVEQPPLISYDAFGDITLSPTAPTSGAGIATLSPIAGTVPGDVDLIAPEGTVDAGEAGIRVSGNLNIAAFAVANAANVSVGGKTSGNTAAVATNVAAATSAAAAAGSSIDAATSTTTRRAKQVLQQPSIITVEVIESGNDDRRERHRPAA